MQVLIHQRPTLGAYVRLLLTRSRRDRRLQHTLAFGGGGRAIWRTGSISQTIGKEIRSLPDVIGVAVAVCGVD
jgi:hypothetical protein